MMKRLLLNPLLLPGATGIWVGYYALYYGFNNSIYLRTPQVWFLFFITALLLWSIFTKATRSGARAGHTFLVTSIVTHLICRRLKYGHTNEIEIYVAIALLLTGWIASWLISWAVVRFGKK